MHVIINTANLHDAEVPISDGAAQLVRMNFNPSTKPRVDRIKALAAALISECQVIQGEIPAGAREALVAMEDVQKASMMAVAAATADL